MRGEMKEVDFIFQNKTTSNSTETQTLLTPICLILITLSSIICFIALFGNLMVAVVIIKRTYMQTPINWLLLNLAICDLAIVIITIPSNVVYKSISWPYGAVGCKYLIMPVMEHFASVGILTHTAISYARFVVIRNAGNTSSITTKLVKITICLIWLISFIVLSVTLMGVLGEFKLSSNWIGRLVCTLEWLSPMKRKVYRLSVFILTYLVPIGITGYSYGRIHYIVDKSLENVNILLADEILIKRRKNSRRLNYTLFMMFLIFAITTLPLQLFMFLYDFRVFTAYDGAGKTFDLLLILFYTQILSNPLVLIYMGDEFRKELRIWSLCSCFIGFQSRRLTTYIQKSLRFPCCRQEETTTYRETLPTYSDEIRSEKETNRSSTQHKVSKQFSSITASYNVKTKKGHPEPTNSTKDNSTTIDRFQNDIDKLSYQDDSSRIRFESFSPYMEFSLGQMTTTSSLGQTFTYCGLDDMSFCDASPRSFEGVISETPI